MSTPLTLSISNLLNGFHCVTRAPFGLVGTNITSLPVIERQSVLPKTFRDQTDKENGKESSHL